MGAGIGGGLGGALLILAILFLAWRVHEKKEEKINTAPTAGASGNPSMHQFTAYPSVKPELESTEPLSGHTSMAGSYVYYGPGNTSGPVTPAPVHHSPLPQEMG
jgi:hypothetical protein